MMATHKSFWPVVSIFLVLGLVALQATAATPSGQKKDKDGGGNTGNPLVFQFHTETINGIIGDIIGDNDNAPYIHGEDGVEASMGRKGNANLDTHSSTRGLWVDFYTPPPPTTPPDPPAPDVDCVFGPCVRPTTVSSFGDPLLVDGVFLRFPTDLDLRGMSLGAEANGTLAIRITTGEDSLVRLVYGPLAKKGLEPCRYLGVPPDIEELRASVKRISDTEWRVEGHAARVTEEIGNQAECLGYVDMPVSFTISYYTPPPS